MKLLIQSPVEHDGKAYAEGDSLTIEDEAQAAALVAAGSAIEFVTEAKKAAKAKTDPAE